MSTETTTITTPTASALAAYDAAALLPADPQAKAEAVLEAVALIEGLCNRAKDIRNTMLESLAEWIKVNGDLTYSTIRYYVGPDKKTKCRDKALGLKYLFDHILSECCGDVDLAWHRMAEFLSSEPFKHGAMRDPLDGRWGEVFEVIVVEDQVQEGKPKAKKLDTAYLR